MVLYILKIINNIFSNVLPLSLFHSPSCFVVVFLISEAHYCFDPALGNVCHSGLYGDFVKF